MTPYALAARKTKAKFIAKISGAEHSPHQKVSIPSDSFRWISFRWILNYILLQRYLELY